jgi:hypothetical protein
LLGNNHGLVRTRLLFSSLFVLASSLGACSGAGDEVDAAPTDGAAGADGGTDTSPEAPPPAPRLLRITELCAQDDGFLIDERGQTEDWIEIQNVSGAPVDLAGYALSDGGSLSRLAGMLAPGAARVFFADEETDQGERHLTFGLSADGEHVKLVEIATRAIVDDVEYPALDINQVYARFPDADGAWAKCRYATPNAPNGATCGPPSPPALPKSFDFLPYTWPKPWPAVPSPLALTELALRPARFVEVANTSGAAVDLTGWTLRLAPSGPGASPPGPADGKAVAWPAGKASLAAGERVAVPISDMDVAAISAIQEFEGVATLFDAQGLAGDRVDFMRLPEGASLARFPEGAGAPGTAFAICTEATPGQPNATCTRPAGKPAVGDRLRRLTSVDEEAALAEGGSEVDSQSVKFMIDMQAGDTVFFLGSRDWALHYTFIREKIYGQPPLDRCDPEESSLFNSGWVDFSLREYFKIEGRRFLLGTLVRYGGSGAQSVEFARGDVIDGPLMKRAFFDVMARVPDPTRWAIRPQDASQIAAARAVEGQVPLMDPTEPFRNQTFQPVTPAIAYGVLKFVPGSELQLTPLGPDTIIVVDEVPNDIPLVGGLITEAFQTPLSHVGILSKNRGTPDMALVDARKDPRLAPFLDKLVRLEVTPTGFSIAEATPADAKAFWDMRRPQGPMQAPRLDTSVRDLVDLTGRGLDDLPLIGAKAAQLAEMGKVTSIYSNCPGAVPGPAGGFAVPVVHSLEHFASSGADAILARWRADPSFAVDPRVRAQGLAEVRAAIIAHPVDQALVTQIEQLASQRFGTERFRMRSSSNTEDLPGFSGAGLYTSVSGAIGDPKHKVADGLHTVWASLWEQRAYDERELARIDHTKAAMGVLIHDAFDQVERANGVAVSRDVLDPIQSGVFTIDAQNGEAAVTNPAPGVTSDQILYTPYLSPPAEYRARSSLASGPVLTPFEMARLTCYLRAITDHFQTKIDPDRKNRWFTMEVEFKFVNDTRDLVIKQARPYNFANADIPADCREF